MNGDFDTLRQSTKSSIVESVWRDHTGWISVPEMTAGADGFEYVGKFMPALVEIGQPLLMGWPAGNKLIFWDDDKLDALRAGDVTGLVDG